jgi:hypothetical protein
MRAMFLSGLFNQPIGAWDVSAVTDMGYMFASASTNQQRAFFDQDIGAWNVSNVTDMEGMFGAVGAGNSQRANFNNGGSATIGAWDVSRVTTCAHVPLGRQQQRQSLPSLQSADRGLERRECHNHATCSALPPN